MHTSLALVWAAPSPPCRRFASEKSGDDSGARYLPNPIRRAKGRCVPH